jgi:hypothetical protein
MDLYKPSHPGTKYTEMAPGSRVVDTDEIKKRFLNEIKQRGYDDKFIDRNEEREILQLAIQLGVNIDSARLALQQVCVDLDYVQESQVAYLMRDQLSAALGNDGKVDRKEFDLVFATVKQAMRGCKTDTEIKRMMVNLLEETGQARIKRGWFTDWYSAMKRELGLVA